MAIKRHIPGEVEWVSVDDLKSVCTECHKPITRFRDLEDDRGWIWYPWTTGRESVCSS